VWAVEFLDQCACVGDGVKGLGADRDGAQEAAEARAFRLGQRRQHVILGAAQAIV
jgi:hypothetical protein